MVYLPLLYRQMRSAFSTSRIAAGPCRGCRGTGRCSARCAARSRSASPRARRRVEQTGRRRRRPGRRRGSPRLRRTGGPRRPTALARVVGGGHGVRRAAARDESTRRPSRRRGTGRTRASARTRRRRRRPIWSSVPPPAPTKPQWQNAGRSRLPPDEHEPPDLADRLGEVGIEGRPAFGLGAQAARRGGLRRGPAMARRLGRC